MGLSTLPTSISSSGGGIPGVDPEASAGASAVSSLAVEVGASEGVPLSGSAFKLPHEDQVLLAALNDLLLVVLVMLGLVSLHLQGIELLEAPTPLC